MLFFLLFLKFFTISSTSTSTSSFILFIIIVYIIILNISTASNIRLIIRAYFTFQIFNKWFSLNSCWFFRNFLFLFTILLDCIIIIYYLKVFLNFFF
jgi:hypothetical protein